ncbi:MAG: carboxypeptidase-like regulatory domain-containing protein [Terracidiphilus sp.]
MWKLKVFLSGLVVAGCLAAVTGFAQNTNSADLRGTVTDPKGNLLAGATVTLLDIEKNLTTIYTTDGAGLYDTNSIVPDHYKVTISAPGFKSYVRGPITLEVGVETLNAQLAVGAAQEQVVVTADLPLLDTEDGSQTDTLPTETMAQLPQYGADWQNFINLLPGSNFSYRTGQTTSINGNLPYNSVLADGATTTLPMSSNSDVTVFETTAEVKVDSNNFSAQYGLGGIIFNQITKGGGDKFHGAVYEYLQNTLLNAASYNFGQPGGVGFQRFDNYGFSVSGPVALPHVKKNVFFYFNYDKTYSNGGSNSFFLSLPTDAMKAGDFTAMPNSAMFDYTTQSAVTYGNSAYAGTPYITKTSFEAENGFVLGNATGAGNFIPTTLTISPMAKLVQAAKSPTGAAFVPEPTVTTGTIFNPTTGEPENNYYTNVPGLGPFIKYFGRLDWTPGAKHRLTISETESDNPAFAYGNGKQFCPMQCQSQDVSRDNAQVSDVWTISPKMVNEARMGFTDQLNFFQPFSYDENYPQTFGVQWGSGANTAPNYQFADLSTMIGSQSNSVYKEMLFDPSDVVTLIKGRHVLHFGGEFLINRADSTAWGNANSGSVQAQGFYSSGCQPSTSAKQAGHCWAKGLATGYYNAYQENYDNDDAEYADFLLGYSAMWYGTNEPEWGMRIKNPQAFVQDDIKLKSNLTLNVGVRWFGTTGMSEVKGNIVDFDPTIWNPGVDPNGCCNVGAANQGSWGGAWYAYSHTNGRKNLQAPVYDTFMPRVGFSWSADPKTVVRGGIGLYNYSWSDDTYGGGIGQAFGMNSGEWDNSNGIYPVLLLDSNGSVDYQQSYGQSVQSIITAVRKGPDGYNGVGLGYNQDHTPVPKIWQYNLTLQREFGNTMMASVAYVGSKGWDLNFPVDINQVPESKLAGNDTAAGTNQRPYPNFTGMGGSTNNANSNYNSLQVVFQKRLSRGFTFNANYTYSKFLDSQDSSGWGSSAGGQPYQNSYCVKCNWGPSNFDQRHQFTFSGVYTLPFGKGAQFLNNSLILDEIVGGWRLSATSRENTGAPFTPTMNNASQTHAQAGTQYPDLIGDPWALVNPGISTGFNSSTVPSIHSLTNWFNKNAFGDPGPNTYGTYKRNGLYGPDYTNLNFSFGKTFNIYKGSKFEMRFDAQNALNHPTFAGPDSSIGDGNLAYINGLTNQGRHVQLYGKFTF